MRNKFLKLKRLVAGCLGLVCAVSAFAPSAVYAHDAFSRTEEYASGPRETGDWYRVDVVNNVSVDDINIHLAEYELNREGKEQPFTQGQIVIPGQTVSKIVRVYNIARSAWIRIKPEYWFEDGMEGVDESMFRFANDDWVKRGEYYYCTRPIPTGETVDFIKEVVVPHTWDSTYANKNFKLIFTADAVQSENFTPDFESEDPWFGTPIEICIHTHYDEPEEMETSSIFGVEFRGGAEGLVRLGNDWFQTWEKLMPGDVKSNTATIKNNYKKPVEIFFYTENIVKGDDPLLEKLRLVIRDGDRILFDDTLDKELKRISLGVFNQGEGTTITYTLYVPPELNNFYALMKTKTKWIFECRLIEDDVKTGDLTNISPWAYAFGCATILLALSIILLIKNKRKESKADA